MNLNPGDRVFWAGHPDVEYRVIGPSQHGTEDRTVIEAPIEGVHFGSRFRRPLTSELTLVPRTVTITVEVPLDEAEAIVDQVTRSPYVADPEAAPNPELRWARRFRRAVVAELAA